MEKKKITYKNILSFLEGNSQRILEELEVQPQHIKEQIAYRRLICRDDCAKTGKCIKCGCVFKGITSIKKSCNLERFPDLMSNIEWQEYKQKNNINE
jgi:hypothetical protein